MLSNSGKPQWWQVCCVTCKLSKMEGISIERYINIFGGRRMTQVLIEAVLGFFWPLLLNYLALAVYYVGSREPNLWTYFESEKVCQAIFWTSSMLKVIYLLTCFVLTFHSSHSILCYLMLLLQFSSSFSGLHYR